MMSTYWFFARHELKQTLVAPSEAKKEAYHIKEAHQKDHLAQKRLPAQVEKNSNSYEKLNAT